MIIIKFEPISDLKLAKDSLIDIIFIHNLPHFFLKEFFLIRFINSIILTKRVIQATISTFIFFNNKNPNTMKTLSLFMVLGFLLVSCAKNESYEPQKSKSDYATAIPDQETEVFLRSNEPVALAVNPGDLIMNVNLPVSGMGVSVAVDCEGNVYYTLSSQSNLYKMDKDGNLLSTTSIVDAGSGDPLFIDEFAWDQTRNVLWSQLHGSNPVDVYTIDPATGIATFAFTSQTISVGVFRDGIAYDGSDGTIWLSGDVSTTIEHYQADGTFINSITPKDAGGGDLGLISGVIVGVGDMLYLGRNGAVEIVQVKKSDGSYISSFASPGGARDEGLECDPVNFAPQLALWSREFMAPGFMSVILLEDGTCLCGGGGVTVDFDIKPTSCPNPLNVKSKGVLPVAILGSDEFDVNEIDLATVQLEGVDPIRHAMEDVTTPVVDPQDECECTTAGPDGFFDLTLKFDLQSIVAAIGPVVDGDQVVLEISGALLDGTEFVGNDCIIIRANK